MTNLIDGRAIAEKVYVDLRGEIADLKSKGVTPGLAVVLVGDNPASRSYVRSKDKVSRELGLHSVKLELPESTTQDDLLARVDELNRDSSVHGILVQSLASRMEFFWKLASIRRPRTAPLQFRPGSSSSQRPRSFNTPTTEPPISPATTPNTLS